LACRVKLGAIVTYFQKVVKDASPQGYFSGIVSSVTVRLIASKYSGDIYFTDLFLQGGSVATGWVGHTSEIQWTLDG
jgi:hypothetical protein